MPVDYQRSTSGGKGNLGKFIERDPRVCAAGLPSAQPDDDVAGSLKHYLLKDEADSLISDVITPTPQPRPLPPLRHPIPLDMRHSGGFGAVAQLINPPDKTKFQCLVEDLKDTPYSSYWKKSLGQIKDPVPMLPEGFDMGTTFGKKTADNGRLYDIVMPKNPLPDMTPEHKRPGFQKTRNFCDFNPDLTYGYRSGINTQGIYAKCCLTDDRVVLGTAGRSIINFIQADFQNVNQPRIGTILAPNNNLKDVPDGYAFGILKPYVSVLESLSYSELNPGLPFFRKCLGHLNSLRKILSTRFLPTFFGQFYLNLKYFDTEKTGWLPKNIVYDYCGTKLIRFDPALIEPLLAMWNAFDGSRIEYKTFVLVLNYRQPSPQIPKIPDFKPETLDFRTTYTEMVKPGQKADERLMAGVPSGRYFDMDFPVTPEGCCKADRTCLPHESDMKSCLNPSVLTLIHVNHRDLYQKRERDVVRRVFEAAGEEFTDERFNAIWEEAKKYHSEGWVCYETFRRALEQDPLEKSASQGHQ